MAEVAGHLSLAELQASYRASEEARLARHYQAIWLLAQGRGGSGRAAAGAHQPVRAVLVGRPAPGERGKADDLDPSGPRRGSRERLKQSPEDGGVWTAKKVAAVMAAELGLASVAEQRGWEALRTIG